MKLECSRQSFEEYSNIKFHENPPVRVELFHSYRRTDRRTQMTELIVTFRNCVNAHKTAKKSHFIEIKTGLITEWGKIKLKGGTEKESCEVLGHMLENSTNVLLTSINLSSKYITTILQQILMM